MDGRTAVLFVVPYSKNTPPSRCQAGERMSTVVTTARLGATTSGGSFDDLRTALACAADTSAT
jgi:hypothetical protein